MRRMRFATIAGVILLLLAGPVVWAAWDVTKPAGTDPVSTVDDTIRADKAAALAALGLEHQFTAANTAGYHLPNSARIGVGVEAAKGTPGKVGTEDSLGRVYYATDTSRWYVGQDNNAWGRAKFSLNKDRTSWIPSPDWQLTSTAWAELAAGAMSVTIETAEACNLLIIVTFTARNDSASDLGVFFNLAIDDVTTGRVTTAPNGLAYLAPMPAHTNDLQTIRTITMTWLAISVTAGSHTIRPCYKIDPGALAYMAMDWSHNTAVVEL